MKNKIKNLAATLLLINVFLSIMFIPSGTFAADKKISTGEVYLEKFLEKTQTLEADFQQTLRTREGEVLQQTEGKFYLHRPGKFRWNHKTPYEQIIVSDGERIWIYDVDLAQVTVQKTKCRPAIVTHVVITGQCKVASKL